MADPSDESTIWRDITLFCCVFLGVFLSSGFWAGPSPALNLLAACVALVIAGFSVFAVRNDLLP